jgi:pSer/pThr/pTyr-binding forkhead associated (FHA) protein
MIQFRILTGAQAGAVQMVDCFPCRIGRASGSEFRLNEPGVWDQHLRLELRLPDGYFLLLQPPALATVNGESFSEVRLRNGDTIEAGSVKLQFWLGETQPASQRLREAATWLGLALFAASQGALIYWLIR